MPDAGAGRATRMYAVAIRLTTIIAVMANINALKLEHLQQCEWLIGTRGA